MRRRSVLRVFHPASPASQRAVSLIELLLVLALVVLLTRIALPGFGSTLERQGGLAGIERLNRVLQLARSVAVTEGAYVTVCSSADGLRCGGSQWEAGLLVFTDHNGDRAINGEDRLIRHEGASRIAGTLRLRSFPNRQYLQYTPEGFTRGQSGNFTWCPASGDARQARQLIFTQSGRIRAARDRDGDGIREGANGNALDCQE